MSYAYRQTRNYEPQNADKVSDELSKCMELQVTMRDVNAHWHKHGTCMGAPGINDIQAAKLDKKIADTTRPWEKQPFSSYDLNDNNAKIKRLEKKLAEVSRGFTGWEFDGGRAEANADINRLQLFFDERPDANKCAQLKAKGFVPNEILSSYQRDITRGEFVRLAGCECRGVESTRRCFKYTESAGRVYYKPVEGCG